MGPFNNREIATAVWLIAIAVWAFRKPKIRESVTAVFRSFCQYKILVSVALMLLYVVAVITGLRAIGMWHDSLLKDSIVWFFVGAMAMMMRFVSTDDTTKILRKILADNIKIVIVLEFLVNTYTFSLPVELIFVPVLSFLTMIDAVASMNKKHAVVEKLAKSILGIAVGAQAICGAIFSSTLRKYCVKIQPFWVKRGFIALDCQP